MTGNALMPLKNFLSRAYRVEFSRDGRWVVWTDSGHLWRAAANGTQRSQLTPDHLDVFLARWSPDGSRLALMARVPGEAWKIYLMSSAGGPIHPLDAGAENTADPSWSPDGVSLAFGRANDEMGNESVVRDLQIVNLETHQSTQIPGSIGLFSPRWSPDGRYIAALTLDQREVRLYDRARQTWSTLPVHSGADPIWSADSQSLLIHASLDTGQPLLRISVPSGKVTQLISLSTASNAVSFTFMMISPMFQGRI